MSKVCYIFTGGEIHSLTDIPSDGNFVIAADSGYMTARRFGVIPDLLVGDFDSLDLSEISADEIDKIEKIKVSPIKDDTDTQLAVDIAISKGISEIHIIGGLGGRADHTLSNIFLLEYIAEKGIEAVISDGKNRIGLLTANGERVTVRREKKYKYISLVSLTDICHGVSVTGVFYPLNNAEITRKYTYAVSNQITGEYAEISITDGKLLIIESSD